MYRKIEVFRREEGVLKICVCFQRLSDGMYFVQSEDFFSATEQDVGSKIAFFAAQAIQLFLDADIADRTEGHNTLEEAISAFDKDFA